MKLNIRIALCSHVEIRFQALFLIMYYLQEFCLEKYTHGVCIQQFT